MQGAAEVVRRSRGREGRGDLEHGVIGQELGAQGGGGGQEARVAHLLHRLPNGQHLPSSNQHFSFDESQCVAVLEAWQGQLALEGLYPLI